MAEYLKLFLSDWPFISLSFYSFFSTYFLISFSKKYADKFNLIDSPGTRKIHKIPIATVGGIGIIFTILPISFFLSVYNTTILIICICALPVFFIGLLDDRKTVAWKWRIITQIAAIFAAIYFTGLKVNFIGNYPFLGDTNLHFLSIPFTVIAILGLTNAFNLIDGIDGLCGLLMLKALLILTIISGFEDRSFMIFLTSLKISIIVFLHFNLSFSNKYKVFLGDCGSCTLGFILAFSAIYSYEQTPNAHDPTLILWIFIIPIIETFNSLHRRATNKKPIFMADKNHLHHTLLSSGISQKNTLYFLLATAILAINLGFIFSNENSLFSLITFVIFSLVTVRFVNYISNFKLN